MDLLTLPTKFIIKRLRELRALFQHSFHTAPSLKFSTKGPLSLKDLQQLAASHSEWIHLEVVVSCIVVSKDFHFIQWEFDPSPI